VASAVGRGSCFVVSPMPPQQTPASLDAAASP
jgi:hypothetical protein